MSVKTREQTLVRKYLTPLIALNRFRMNNTTEISVPATKEVAGKTGGRRVGWGPPPCRESKSSELRQKKASLAKELMKWSGKEMILKMKLVKPCSSSHSQREMIRRDWAGSRERLITKREKSSLSMAW